MTTEPSGPAADYINRVPRTPIDDHYVRGDPLPETRVGIGTVMSIESDTCCVLIVDEEICGVVFLGYPPVVGDVVEVEARGDLLVIPAIASIDTYLEGISTAQHIVDDSDPGLPAGKDVNVAGSMKELAAWYFISPEDKTWFREQWSTGSGLRCFQQNATLQARNLATNPSLEVAVTGWEANTGFGAYVPPVSFGLTNERSVVGLNSLKVSWGIDAAKASSINHTVTTVTIGKTYTASCWVYVPAGSPDVHLGSIFYANGPYTTIKDQWVRISVTWTATVASLFFNVTTRVPSPGGLCYIDGFMITEGSDVLDYFDGDTTDFGTDLFQWDGATGLSTSAHYVGTPAPTLLSKNLIPNPSFELAATGWLSVNCNYARVATPVQVGGYALECRNTTPTSKFGISFAADAIVAGKTYTISAWVQCIAAVKFGFTSTGGVGGSSTPVAGTGTWQRHSHTFTALGNGSGLQYLLEFSPPGPVDPGELAGYIDGVMLEESPTLNPYFDGDTTDTATEAYIWEGSPHQSVSAHYLGGDPTPPAAGAGTLWNSEVFEVEPGDKLDLTVVAQWIRDSPTAQLVVLYGSDPAVAPDPASTDTATTWPVAYGTPFAVTGADPVTMTVQAVVPDLGGQAGTGTFQPRLARIGIKLVGDGTGDLVLGSVVLTQAASGWELGSLWLDPDGESGGVMTVADTGIGSNVGVAFPIATVGAWYPTPSMKKITVTAPKDCGGIVEVSFAMNVWTTQFVVMEFGIATTQTGSFIGSMPQVSVAASSRVPVTMRALYRLEAGETAHFYPLYRYATVNPTTAFSYARGNSQAIFNPSAVMTGAAPMDPSIRWWDGDSWRPPMLEPADIDVTQDTAVAPPAKTATSTTISRSGGSGSIKEGQTVTLNAVVTAGSVGSVTFQKSTAGSSGPWTSLGSVTLSGAKASKIYKTTGRGYQHFRAVYNGSSTRLASTSTATPALKVLRKGTFKATSYASWVQAYNGSGGKISGSSHDGAVSQGYYSSTHGNQASMIRLKLGTVAGEDREITKVVLHCKNWEHWYYNGGGTISLGWHEQATPLATWSGSSSRIDQSRHDVDTGAWAVNITSWAKSVILRSDFEGITVGEAPSTAKQFYGYAANGAGPWWLEIEGTSWT